MTAKGEVTVIDTGPGADPANFDDQPTTIKSPRRSGDKNQLSSY
jgi:hypothetical protein